MTQDAGHELLYSPHYYLDATYGDSLGIRKRVFRWQYSTTTTLKDVLIRTSKLLMMILKIMMIMKIMKILMIMMIMMMVKTYMIHPQEGGGRSKSCENFIYLLRRVTFLVVHTVVEEYTALASAQLRFERASSLLTFVVWIW